MSEPNDGRPKEVRAYENACAWGEGRRPAGLSALDPSAQAGSYSLRSIAGSAPEATPGGVPYDPALFRPLRETVELEAVLRERANEPSALVAPSLEVACAPSAVPWEAFLNVAAPPVAPAENAVAASRIRDVAEGWERAAGLAAQWERAVAHAYAGADLFEAQGEPRAWTLLEEAGRQVRRFAAEVGMVLESGRAFFEDLPMWLCPPLQPEPVYVKSHPAARSAQGEAARGETRIDLSDEEAELGLALTAGMSEGGEAMIRVEAWELQTGDVLPPEAVQLLDPTGAPIPPAEAGPEDVAVFGGVAPGDVRLRIAHRDCVWEVRLRIARG